MTGRFLCAIATATGLALVNAPALADTATTDDRRAQCVAWMMSAYPSGIEEVACTQHYGLPSPFMFQCVRAQRSGYETQAQKDACRAFFVRAVERTEAGYVKN
ncbi:MAG: hypothetical protein AAFQ88_12250 [Pseudomonadota bacterium]